MKEKAGEEREERSSSGDDSLSMAAQHTFSKHRGHRVATPAQLLWGERAARNSRGTCRHNAGACDTVLFQRIQLRSSFVVVNTLLRSGIISWRGNDGAATAPQPRAAGGHGRSSSGSGRCVGVPTTSCRCDGDGPTTKHRCHQSEGGGGQPVCDAAAAGVPRGDAERH